MDRKRLIKLLLTLILPLVIVALRPLDMDLRQSAVLAVLILVIQWWVTGAVGRTAASAVLLVFFLFFSGASPRTIFTFPLSENFIMVAVSFLFSYGISASGLTDRLLSPVLSRFAQTPLRLVLMMILSAAVMIFVIPQPISRVIILGGIFAGYFERAGLSPQLRAALMSALFVFIMILNMSMIRGDLILNPTVMAMAGMEISEGEWIRSMMVPTLIYLAIFTLIYLLLFRRLLRTYRPAPPASERPAPLSAREKGWLVLIGAVVILWALEDLHGLSGTVLVCIGTAAMFPAGLLRPRDLKEVNVPLLLFLTAAFAIGGGLKGCGVADLVFSQFIPLFPASFSTGYALLALLTTIALHMLLGSNITAMSVVVPGLMSIGAGVAPAVPLLFIIFLGICGHSLLPFHHVLLLMGEGRGYYTGKDLLRLTLLLTVLIFPVVLVLYMGWWQITGLL